MSELSERDLELLLWVYSFAIKQNHHAGGYLASDQRCKLMAVEKILNKLAPERFKEVETALKCYL